MLVSGGNIAARAVGRALRFLILLKFSNSSEVTLLRNSEAAPGAATPLSTWSLYIFVAPPPILENCGPVLIFITSFFGFPCPLRALLSTLLDPRLPKIRSKPPAAWSTAANPPPIAAFPTLGLNGKCEIGFDLCPEVDVAAELGTCPCCGPEPAAGPGPGEQELELDHIWPDSDDDSTTLENTQFGRPGQLPCISTKRASFPSQTSPFASTSRST